MALAAQGFTDPPPTGRIDLRHVRRVMGRTGLFQIDSVNVLQRAHYVPLFSRLGPYPTRLLDDATYSRREFFEYWVHEASIVPIDLHPLMRHRMAARRRSRRATALIETDPGYIDRVLEEVARHGPLTAADLSDPGSSSGSWWGWSKGKVALEYLFAIGSVAVADRRRFVRLYDLAERVVPEEVLGADPPAPDDARRSLLLRAARHLGVGTVDDLIDYYRLRPRSSRPLVEDLVRSGDLVEVAVDGWDQPALLDPEARFARRVIANTMLSPFDPVVFHRPRAQRLFDFHYRIEIYVPPSQRVYGYYVLPYLHGDRIVGRADLKADRAARRLLVRGAWWEDSADGRAAADWTRALVDLATWLDLGDVAVTDHGNAAPALRACL